MLIGFFGLGTQEIVLLLGCGCTIFIPVIVLVVVLKVAKKKTPSVEDYEELDE